MLNRYKLLLLIIVLYTFRFIYCLHGYLYNPMWLSVGDESHIYLLGLKYYITGEYPYFGPDIVYNSSYLVGGLQGILIGCPLLLFNHPFAPYFFLFILLSLSLLYLSWYICKLFPALPKWLIYTIVALAPYTVHTGLKVINPAYVLCFSVPFIFAFIEEFELFDYSFIHKNWRYFWLGLGVTAVFQLHASWVFMLLLLIAVLINNFVQNVKDKLLFFRCVLFTCLGLLVGIITVIPTVVVYGFEIVFMQGRSSRFNLSNIIDIPTVIYNFLNLIGYEMNSFCDAFLVEPLFNTFGIWAAAIFIFLQAAGILLVILQVTLLFSKRWKPYVKRNKKFLQVIVIMLVGLGVLYMFSYVRPGIHAMICLLPLSAIYLCWFLNVIYMIYKNNKTITNVLITFFVCLIGYYGITILATDRLPNLGYREKAFNAIEKKDASIFETPRYVYPTKLNR